MLIYLVITAIALTLILVLLDQTEWIRANVRWLSGIRLYILLALCVGTMMGAACYQVADSLIPYVASRLQELLNNS